MRAIIIDDKDARTLLDQLKLELMQKEIGYRVEGKSAGEIAQDMHARFHFVVCRWLQDQGANIVR